jgi:2-(3-amino-3-carboxypropyl)histidine synthase
MKKIFIEAKELLNIELSIEIIERFKGKTLGLITTIQHLHNLDDIANQLDKAVIGGQILGCNVFSAEKIKDKVDAFLYIGTGKFHPIAVKLKTDKEVFTYNPYTQEISSIDEAYAKKIEQKKKVAFVKFLDSKNIGILVSIKPGQHFLKKALKFKNNLKDKYPEKNVFLFIGDMLIASEAENFPFIDVLINTACPRIAEDNFPRPIINIDDLIALLEQ